MRKKWFSLMILCSIIFQMLFLSVFILQSTSSASALPTVAISLTEVSQTAHVGPGDTGEVSFNGMVSVTLNPMTRVVVSLAAEDTWGSSVVSPETLLFTEDGTQGFVVNVTVPLGTSFTNSGMVTVTARWTMYPGTIGGSAEPVDGAQGRIEIAQYFQFSLNSKLLYLETAPGNEVEFELDITNEGNFFDTFSIEITNDYKLNLYGFQTALSSSNVEIPEKENETIKILLRTPTSESSLGEYEIQVKVWSDKGLDEEIQPQSITFDLKVTKTPRSSKDVETPDSDDITDEIAKLKKEKESFIEKINLYIIIILIVIVVIILMLVGWWKVKGRPRKKIRSIKRVKLSESKIVKVK